MLLERKPLKKVWSYQLAPKLPLNVEKISEEIERRKIIHSTNLNHAYRVFSILPSVDNFIHLGKLVKKISGGNDLQPWEPFLIQTHAYVEKTGWKKTITSLSSKKQLKKKKNYLSTFSHDLNMRWFQDTNKPDWYLYKK